MKTKNILKILLALMAVLIIFSLTSAVFAQAENSRNKETAKTQTDISGTAAEKTDKPSRKSGRKDFRELTEDDLEEFFEKYFSEKCPHPEDGKKSDGKHNKGQTTESIKMPGEQTVHSGPQMKGRDFPKDSRSKDSRPFPPKCNDDRDDDDDIDDDDKAEDIREHKGFRKHGIDFSELPDDPTDEEILDFFKKYFPGKSKSEGTEPAPVKEPAPENPETAPTEEPAPETL